MVEQQAHAVFRNEMRVITIITVFLVYQYSLAVTAVCKRFISMFTAISCAAANQFTYYLFLLPRVVNQLLP